MKTDMAEQRSNSSSARHQPKSRARIERTRVACSECKRRRAKCSGAPSPCEACKRNGSFCHFNRKLDTRRKVSMSADEIHQRVKYVLDALLLGLRYNPQSMVDNLLQTLRKSYLAPWDLAKEVRKHISLVQDQGMIAPIDVDHDDLLSVALNVVVSLCPKSDESSKDEKMDKQQLQNGHEVNMIPTQIDDSVAHSPTYDNNFGSASMQSDLLEALPLGPDSDLDSDSDLGSSSNALEPDNEQQSTVASSWTGDLSPVLADSHFGVFQRTASSTGASVWWYQIPDPDAFQVHAPLITNASLPSTLATHRAFDPPLLDPRTDFCNFCMAVRNSGRRALANGIPLARLTFWNRIDCELLFRERVKGDDCNIPNWACEVARRFPPMKPTARMAFAVLLTKVMPYLIAPSEYTWSRLPTLLRPTELQRQVAHDISISFLPIPALRDSLIQRSIDWLGELIRHDCGVRWLGSFGDVGAVKLTDAGNWCEQPDWSSLDTDRVSGQNLGSVKAVLFDPAVGRRYLSDEFQQSCCEPANWYASQGILKTWPELLGQIQLL